MKLSKLFCSAGLVVIAGVVIGAAAGGREAWGEGLPKIVQEALGKEDLGYVQGRLIRSAQRAESKPSPGNLLALYRRLSETASQLARTSDMLRTMADSLEVASVKGVEGTQTASNSLTESLIALSQNNSRNNGLTQHSTIPKTSTMIEPPKGTR